jgi:peptidase C39-like protein
MGDIRQEQPLQPEAPRMSRSLQIINAVKANVVPLIMSATTFLSANALLSPVEAEAQSAPVHPFVNYDQGDWGSRYAESGCGPTSAAMVAATETGNRHITPHTIGHLLTPGYWAHGAGTRPAGFHAVAERYGLKEKHASLYAAERALMDGGLAIVHAKPGHFTGAGHYMVLKSFAPIGGRFRLADPNDAPGRDSEVRWWSPDQLKANGIDDAWTFLPPDGKQHQRSH